MKTYNNHTPPDLTYHPQSNNTIPAWPFQGFSFSLALRAFRWPWPAFITCGDISSPTLEDVLAATGVDPALSNHILSEGWTTETFSCSALTMQEFDSHLSEMCSGHDLSMLQKAALRAAFKRCQQADAEPSAPSRAEDTQISSSAGSWTETFAPKLDNATIHALKSKFIKDYPSELLNADTTPSTRLLSLVHHQLQKKHWVWVPWKYRMSLARSEEVQTQRAAKQPRIEGIALSQLLLDEVPSLEITNQGMGLNAIRVMMEVHNVAIAMCGGAHLANLKEYTHKFMSLLTQRVDSESGLRTANVVESQAADRQVWRIMCDLMNDRNWTMDNALHEMTHIRHDLPGLLQLRPKIPKQPPTWTSSSILSSPKGVKGKGKSSVKGKGKGAGKGKVTWVTELKQSDGSFKQLCMQWQVGKCQRSNCAFIHGCAYPLPDGSACGKGHTAVDHQKVPQ